MDEDSKARKERMKEYRRRYEEKHGIKRRHFNWKWPVATLAVLVVLGTGSFFYAQSKTIDSVLLDGQPVTDMSEADIRSYLDQQEAAVNEKKMELKGQDIDESVSLSKLDASFDRQRINDEIYLVGRVGSPIRRVADVYKTLRYGKNVALAIKVDNEKLSDYLESVHKKYDVEVRNAYAAPESDGTATIHKERPQIDINTAALQTAVKEELANGVNNAVDVPVSSRVDADVKAADLKGIDTVLSSYTTHFDPQAENRDENIAICTKLLSRTIVPAQKDFSFNETVGTRTKDKGYKDAPVYFDNKVVDDAGGGVCQVSTTLFNAALRAGLVISHRAPHYAPAGYVPVGMDATVADNSLDFGFTNPFQHPVYVYTEYSNDAITVYILGNHEDTCTVTFQTLAQKTLAHKVIKKHDDSVQEDIREQEGYDGHDISIRRHVVYKDGQTYTDTIDSHYDPNTSIIRTPGPSSEETVQATNLEGETSQDPVINLPHDPTAPVSAPAAPVPQEPAKQASPYPD